MDGELYVGGQEMGWWMENDDVGEQEMGGWMENYT